jgi:hypothetical protein
MSVELGLFGLENLVTEGFVERKAYEALFVNAHASARGSTAAFVAPAAVFRAA